MKSHLPILTLVGLLAGVFVGMPLQGRTSDTEIEEEEFIRDVNHSKSVPIIVTSNDLEKLVCQRPKAADTPLELCDSVTVLVPDRQARAFFSRQVDSTYWFDGSTESVREVFRTSSDSTPPSHPHESATLHAVGAVLRRNKTDGTVSAIAHNANLLIDLHPRVDHQPNTGTRSPVHFNRRSSFVSYFGFVGDLYVTFLLMLFVPTLAVSLIKAVVDSSSALSLFMRSIVFFLASGLIASFIGVCIGVASYTLVGDSNQQDLETLSATALGIQPSNSVQEYDAHPILTQLSKIIPTNPLSALTDPNSSSGLQVAFVAILLGVVLSFLHIDARRKLSDTLKRVLAVIVKDNDLAWKALSDIAEYAAPLGLFFVATSVVGTLDYQSIKQLVHLGVAIVLGLVVHTICLIAWVRFRRNWPRWKEDGLIPSLSAFSTAFATASSYATLPSLSATPLMAKDNAKRGRLDLGMALNKNGTILYMAAVAAYIFCAGNSTLNLTNYTMILGTAVIAGVATAGLPFAAIFGLQMVLVANNLPGGLAWLILWMDPIVDRFVTVVNVVANVAGCSDPRGAPLPQPIDPLLNGDERRRIEPALLAEGATPLGSAESMRVQP